MKGVNENKNFGIRKAKQIIKRGIVVAVGVVKQAITSLETGRYTASLVFAYKIARYFGLTIEEVLDFSDVDLNN